MIINLIQNMDTRVRCGYRSSLMKKVSLTYGEHGLGKPKRGWNEQVKKLVEQIG